MNRSTQLFMSFCFFGLFLAPLSAQTSSISGTVLDAEARYPLINATVQLKSVEGVVLATDLDGRFTFNNVPVGRHLVVASFMGYESRVL
ncbi:MAG: carboxypeptidase-like regulatory domain-containing protein, partial [Flavobacteriales bacterium]